MALGEKYRVHVDHQFGGDSRYVRIYLEGYSGAVTEPTGSLIPGLLEFPGADNDIFDPIYGSELTVNIHTLSSEQFIEFATARNKQYLAQVYNDDQTVVEWQGWLLPSEYEEPYNQVPFETTLIFNCGLGLMDGIDYLDTDGSYYLGRASEISILAACMAKIYPASLHADFKPHFTAIVNLWDSGQSASIATGTLDQTKVEREKYINSDGTVWSCLDVIKDIVGSYEARISIGRGVRWTIIRIRDLALFYSSYEMHYVNYTELGAYEGNGGIAKATLTKTVTGPQARSTMVGWIGGDQMVRHERAYKKIKITQNHFYTSLIRVGDFKHDQWADFWVVTGTATRVQSGDDADTYAIKLASASSIRQEFAIDGTGTSPYQTTILSFEGMVVHDDAYTTIAWAFTITRDTGAVLQYLVGTIGGAAPATPVWQIGAGNLFFTNEDGLPSSEEWHKFELIIEYFPADVDIVWDVLYPGTAGAGIISGAYYRNIKLLGTYTEIPPDKTTVLEQIISEDNIHELKDIEVNLSDIILSGNEGLYFLGAKTIDTPGYVPTEDWYSYRYNAGARAYVGPTMSLLEYKQFGKISQHGINRKRITGQMNLNTERWNMFVLEDDSILYVPTQAAIDFKRGEVDLSLVELPDIVEPIAENLILGWTNNDFDSFAATADLITAITSTGNGKYADSDAAIAYKAHERFRVTADGTMSAGFRLAFGGYNMTLEDGFDQDIVPAAAGSTTPRLSATTGDEVTMTDVTIVIKRLYGY